jgi:hypothetical protein
MTSSNIVTLDADERAEAVRIAKSIGDRVAEPAVVRDVFEQSSGLRPEFSSDTWDPLKLSSGCSAPGLLLGALDSVDPADGWEKLMHGHFEASAGSSCAGLGLMNGWAGLLVAAGYVSIDKPRYSQLRSWIRTFLSAAAEAAYRKPFQNPTTCNDFDLVTGAAGMYLALAYRQDNVPEDNLLAYLCWLVSDAEGRPSSTSSEQTKGAYDGLGAAHGLAGVLAAICRAGRSVERDAVLHAVCEDLIVKAGASANAPPRPASDGRAPPTTWCSGSLGFAAALCKAGIVLGRKRYLEIGKASLEPFESSDPSAWGLRDCSLCHGLAGAAVVLHRLARVVQSEGLSQAAARCARELIRSFDADSKLGYTFLDPDGRAFDATGLLIGVSGVGLALLTVAGAINDSWTVLLGL